MCRSLSIPSLFYNSFSYTYILNSHTFILMLFLVVCLLDYACNPNMTHFVTMF